MSETKLTRSFIGIYLGQVDGSRLKSNVILFKKTLNGKVYKKPFKYILPTSPLRKAKISITNQPFYLEEYENSNIRGCSVIYKFIPMATKNQIEIESIKFSKVYKNKLQEIQKYFKA